MRKDRDIEQILLLLPFGEEKGPSTILKND